MNLREGRLELVEAVDHGIGAKRVNRHRRIAVAHQDERDAGGVCSPCIGEGIAREDRRPGAAAGACDRLQEVQGIGLAHGKRVRAEQGLKPLLPAECGKERAGQGFGLVGADGKPAAGQGQTLEESLRMGKGPAVDGNVGGIEGEERPDPGFDQRLVGRPAGAEAPAQQRARPFAHHGAHRLRRHRRAVEHAERVVERSGKVGCGVDQCAIEIEHEGDAGGHGRPVAASARAGQGAPFLALPAVAGRGWMTDRPLAVICLAAGRGTRMQSSLHKVLHPIGGQPMLFHLLDSVARLAPARAIVVVGDRGEQVEEALRGRGVETVRQEPQLGTGHAVQQAGPALADFAGDILILFGDAPFVRTETMAAMREALARGADLVVLGFRPAEPGAYGRIVADAGGGILRMVEARDATPEELAIPLCNAGPMAVRSERLWALLGRVGNRNVAGEYYLPDIVGLGRAEGLSVQVVEAEEAELLGVNSRAELAAAEAAFQARARAAAMAAGVTLVAPETVIFAHDTVLEPDVTVEPFVVFAPGVVVETGSKVRSHSHLEGARVGPGCEVGPFARLRPGTVLEAEAKVGNFVETKNARLGAGAKANHLSYLGDATIGARANIGAGTITCNYDGFAKHQTRIGAGAFIGSNSALVAPVSIGAGAIVGAGSVIVRDVADDALAVARGAQEERAGLAARFRAARAAASGKTR